MPQLGGDLDLNNNDITGTGAVNITGNVTATSIISDTLTHSTAGSRTTDYIVQGSAIMWQAWFYSGSTPTSQGGFNVSSITDTGTGDAAFNLTNAMASRFDNCLWSGTNHAGRGNMLVDKDSASIVASRVIDDTNTLVDAGGSFSIGLLGVLA